MENESKYEVQNVPEEKSVENNFLHYVGENSGINVSDDKDEEVKEEADDNSATPDDKIDRKFEINLEENQTIEYEKEEVKNNAVDTSEETGINGPIGILLSHSFLQNKRPAGKSYEYQCDQCDFVSAYPNSLKRHKGRHDEIGYSHDSALKQLKYRDKESGAVTYPCVECDYVAKVPRALKTHIEVEHKEEVYSCDQCDFVSKFFINLKKHKRNMHEKARFPCDQCDYVAKQYLSLKTHKEKDHEGVRYPCDQCDFIAKEYRILKVHKESKHEGVTYPCDQCDFIAKYFSNLKQHKKNKHEGVRYQCDQCDHFSTRQTHLRTHKEKMHKQR